ncbi:prepilin peptidase [Phenylobacterium sp. LjRoot219]|uniref:A24 family peptidase n=1 Tax=Phenylobacterium sp. LjRoot219 TaxID=3342283 RepID=UPI003ECE4ACD
MIHTVLTAALMAFPALVILGGVRDLISYRIPNWISLALLAAFIPAALIGLAAGVPLSALGLNLAVGAAALVAGVVMWSLRWIGGGDAKLFAAAALWIGWPAAGTYLAVTGLVGGVFALLLLRLRAASLRSFVLSGPAWFTRLAEPGESVPYGVAIAIGALVAFPNSALVLAAAAL